LRWSRLFPHFASLLVERVLVTTEAVHVQVRRAARTAHCPACGRRSRRVHSRYSRRVADEPIGGRPVEIHLEIRRFRCGNPSCPRRTFAEQVPQLVGRRARRTVPLLRLLQDVALTIGGRPGPATPSEVQALQHIADHVRQVLRRVRPRILEVVG
jgi:transposase